MSLAHCLSYGIVFSLCARVLVAGEGYRGGFFEKLPQTSPMSYRTYARMDLPLAKTEHTSDGGNTSGMIHLKREKNCCAAAAGERSENM